MLGKTALGVLAVLLLSWLRGRSLGPPLETCAMVASVLGASTACHELGVRTADGHRLGLSRVTRVPSVVAESDSDSDRAGAASDRVGAVLLLHGLADSSLTFVVSGEHSLVAHLVKAGFDVYMLDQRGRAPYAHDHLDEGDAAYWDFGLDEVVDMDIPAAVAKVAQDSGGRLKAIIGHSQGGVVGALALATHPAVAANVDALVLLGSPLALWRGGLLLPLFPHTSGMAALLAPSSLTTQMRAVGAGFCATLPGLCTTLLCALAGCESEANFAPGVVAHAMRVYPREVSYKNLAHLAQCDGNGGLHRFDDRAASYNVTRLVTPTALFYGDRDGFLHDHAFRDVVRAIPPKALRVAHGALPYGHGDFIWGISAAERMYPELLHFIHEDHEVREAHEVREVHDASAADPLAAPSQ